MIATSAIAFLSLIVSDIQPVIYFGLIMVLGLVCAFIITFTALPALIKIVQPRVADFKTDKSSNLLNNLLNVILGNQRTTVLAIFTLIVLSVTGITQMTVENRFIDYFKDSTDIHKGLVFVDQELGGTCSTGACP
jgi:predicted RND superfamily exporter protein